jgi:hypothetical protein
MVATLYRVCSKPNKYSTMGDLPVPPTAKLPTQMSGKLKLAELR